MKLAIILTLSTLVESSRVATSSLHDAKRLRTREVYKSKPKQQMVKDKKNNNRYLDETFLGFASLSVPIDSLSLSINLDDDGADPIIVDDVVGVNGTTLNATDTTTTPPTTTTNEIFLVEDDIPTNSSAEEDEMLGETPDDETIPTPSCPETLTHMHAIDDISTMYYTLVPSTPSTANNGILCARIEVNSDKGWVGFGISTTGEMKDSQGILGLPNDDGLTGSVLKYWLSNGDERITEMSADKQTLLDTSITQEIGGLTTMSFTKLLVEEGDEIPILESGENIFLHARGPWNWPSYHDARMAFVKDFALDEEPLGGGLVLEPGPVILPPEDGMSMSLPMDLSIDDISDAMNPTMKPTIQPTMPGNLDPTPTPTTSGSMEATPIVGTDNRPPTAAVSISTTEAPVAPSVVSTPCAFCPNGIPDPDKVVTTSDEGNAATCEVTNLYASTLQSNTIECNDLQLIEIVCCSSEASDSTPTLDGIAFAPSPKPVAPPANSVDRSPSSRYVY